MPTTINSNYSLYTDTTKKTSDKDKKENEKKHFCQDLVLF